MKKRIPILVSGIALMFATPGLACELTGQNQMPVGQLLGDASATGTPVSVETLANAFVARSDIKAAFAKAGCDTAVVKGKIVVLMGGNPAQLVARSAPFIYPTPNLAAARPVQAPVAAQPNPVASTAPVAAPSATPSPAASAAPIPEATASAAAPKLAPVVAAPLAVKPLPARVNVSEIWVAINALKTSDAEIRTKIEQTPPDQLTPEQLTLLNQLAAIPDLEARLRNLPVNGEVETSTLPAPQQAAVQQVIAAQSLAEEYLGRETLDGMTVAYAPFMLFFLIVSIFGIRAYRNRKTEIASAVGTALQVDGLSHTMLAARLDAVEDSVKNIGEQTGATDKVDLGQTQLQALSALPAGDELDTDVFVNNVPEGVVRWKRTANDHLVIVTKGIVDYTDGTPIARPEAFVRKAYKDGRLRLVLSPLVLTQQSA